MKVLIIDDDTFVRTVYNSLLTEEGYEVLQAADGEEGFKELRKSKPDIVLLDMILPKMTGFDVLEKKRKNASIKSIPVIVISDLGQKNDIDRAKKLGARMYLPKGEYSPNEIVTEINKLTKK
ncbi:response regulator [Patescibacteria group bacterium]|nr:response regulator [Patescibacteria group bacterium]